MRSKQYRSKYCISVTIALQMGFSSSSDRAYSGQLSSGIVAISVADLDTPDCAHCPCKNVFVNITRGLINK